MLHEVLNNGSGAGDTAGGSREGEQQHGIMGMDTPGLSLLPHTQGDCESHSGRSYPLIITGSYPLQKREHKLSPLLCKKSKSAANRCHWKVEQSLDLPAAPRAVHPRADGDGIYAERKWS